jgi:hypothetical protein
MPTRYASIIAGSLALTFAGLAPAMAQKVGNWNISTFPSNGPANGCIMGTNYTDGTRVSVYVTKDMKWGLGFFNKSWNLTANAKEDVVVRVDGRVIATGKVQFLEANLVALPLFGDDAFQALRYGNSMGIHTSRGRSGYRLTGTARAMAATLDCARAVARQSSSTAFGGPSQAPAQPKKDFRILTTAEAAVTLTNLLGSAGMAGFTIDPPKQGTSALTFRLADGSSGLFMAGVGRDTALADDYVAVVLKRFADRCKGEFLSGRKSLPTEDGTVVRQLVTSCRQDGTMRNIETTIVRRADGYLMELTQFDPRPSLGGEGSGAAGGGGKQRSPLVDAAIRMR